MNRDMAPVLPARASLALGIVIALWPAFPARSQEPPAGPSPLLQRRVEPPAGPPVVPPPSVPPGSPTAAPAPRPPEVVLRDKGLRRVGVVFRLEDEALVERQVLAAQNLQRNVEMATQRFNGLEAEIGQLNAILSGLKTTETTSFFAKDEADRRRLEDADRERVRLDRARARQIQQRIDSLATDQRRQREMAEKGLAALPRFQQTAQGSYEVLVNRYRDLGLDPEVKAALAELNKTARPMVVLGPVEGLGHYRKIVAKSADESLRLKGLVPDGSRYVLASELKAKTQAAALRAALAKLAKVASPPDPGARRKELADKLAKANTAALRSLYRDQLEKLDKANVRHPAGTSPPTATPGVDLRADVLRAVVELRKTAEIVRGQQATLTDDAEVKEAIAELNKGRSARNRVRVAAVPEAAQAIKRLEEAQADINLQAVPLRDEGGARLVDAPLAGGPATGLVVDALAAGLRLSSALASRAGVVAAPEAATVTVTLPDGRTVAARRGTMPSLRLGSFELADVPCLVLPPETGDPRPVLGIKDLGPTSAHHDSAGTLLYLARIGLPSPPRP